MSQIPFILEMGWDIPLKATWIVLFSCLFVKDPLGFIQKPLLQIYACVISFEMYCMLMHGISEAEYLNVDCVNVAISTMICSTSFVYFRNYFSEKSFQVLGFVILPSIVILALIVYAGYLSGYDLSERTYAFENKNSMGQILLCGIVISHMSMISSVKKLKCVNIVALLFCTYVIIAMKARATIIGFVYIFVHALFKTEDKKIRIGIVVFVLSLIVSLSLSDNLYELIIENIILGNRDVGDINDVSSDRVFLISDALPMISENFIFGIGNNYLDCMPIAMLLQFGLIGSFFIFTLIIIMFRRTISLELKNPIHNTTFILFATMLLNSLFEAQPPFGPGIKCFLLWVLFGFSMAIEYNKNPK